ncbi:Oidioi.mRNA.OKI2018_I69.XSR.g13508.t1.cds [Oikopleura dioica]|uniref:Oidioi.mRNA.OKI2018_I69.XSR.g13508.t1.cds n=1 Tax=Oikopleura dioica TaxID=34765 RepID=A0ABN7SAS5_OIKDI|nr:Oidioi.mRNA.OKI2018_I69.XSR.g13508.t1.cds [Oikopleura dioica]
MDGDWAHFSTTASPVIHEDTTGFVILVCVTLIACCYGLFERCREDGQENQLDEEKEEAILKVEHQRQVKAQQEPSRLNSFEKQKSQEVNTKEQTQQNPSSCPICFQVFNGNDCQECTLPCGHRFCNDCLNRLSSCPICRKPFTNDQIIKLY